MRFNAFLSAALLSIPLAWGAWAGAAKAQSTDANKAWQAAASDVTVIELFTAQGCAPCRPANLSLAQWADAPNVIVLTFPVHHWDYLGWRDTFAQPEFADRHRAYAEAMGTRGLKTPQIVVNGAREESGAASIQVRDVIARSPRTARTAIRLRPLADGMVTVQVGAGAVRSRAADVWVVRFEPRPAAVTPQRGETAGRPVLQRNVVQEIDRVAAWMGNSLEFNTPCMPACAVIVQEQNGGLVLGASLHRP